MFICKYMDQFRIIILSLAVSFFLQEHSDAELFAADIELSWVQPSLHVSECVCVCV